MKLLQNPWDSTFQELVSASRFSIKITSPYVKSNVVESLLKTKSHDVKFSLVTSFKLMNYHVGVSDIDALESILSADGLITNYHKLHSKIYIFDDKSAVVTSANMTNGGLRNNYEYGVFIDDKFAVNKINSDFDALLQSEIAGTITQTELAQAKEILAGVPKSQPIVLPEISAQNETEEFDVFTGGTNSIKASLTGWKAEIFGLLETLAGTEFTIDDVKQFIPHLQKLFPGNHNVEPKIRQQLQFLRDIGLIEFLGNGRYRKLWS